MRSIPSLLMILSSSALMAQAGVLDPMFADQGIALTQVCTDTDMGHAIAQQSNGKYIVIGQYFTDLGVGHGFAARYDQDGTLDLGFGPNNTGTVLLDVSPFGENAHSVVVLPDDRILIGGNAAFAGYNQWYVMRLEPDGQADPMFGGPGSITADSTNSSFLYSYGITLDADGRILIGGMRALAGTVLRLLPDGDLDASFGIGGYATAPTGQFFSSGDAVSVDDQGRIMLAGSTAVGLNTNVLSAVFRFNENGLLDTDFGSNGIFMENLCFGVSETFMDMIIDPNGNILLTGAETNNGIAAQDAVVLRLLPSGQPDVTFGAGGKASLSLPNDLRSAGNHLAIQSDGRVLLNMIVGTMEPNSEVMGLARFNAYGTLDATFGLNSGYTLTDLDAPVNRVISWGMCLDDQERIVLAGEASWDDSEVVLARYTNVITAGSNELVPPTSGISFLPVPEGYQLVHSTGRASITTYRVIDPLGRVVDAGQGRFVDLRRANAGTYMLIANVGEEQATLRVIKP